MKAILKGTGVLRVFRRWKPEEFGVPAPKWSWERITLQRTQGEKERRTPADLRDHHPHFEIQAFALTQGVQAELVALSRFTRSSSTRGAPISGVVQPTAMWNSLDKVCAGGAGRL